MDYTNIPFKNSTIDIALGYEIDCACENFQSVNIVNEQGTTADLSAQNQAILSSLQTILTELEEQTIILSTGA